MIFVTVGTHGEGFERLIRELDRLTESCEIKEDVFAQIGQSSYVPSHMGWSRLLGGSDLGAAYRKARIVVTHGGAGSVIWGISSGKPLVIVPRLKKFGEAVDDHQLDLAKKLEETMKLSIVYDVKNLKEALAKARPPRRKGTSMSLSKEIGYYVDLL